MKELVLKRIKELYEDYSSEKDNPRWTFFTDTDMTLYALKVLVDIYTDDGTDDHRLIYHDSDVILATTELILEKEAKNELKQSD